MKSLPSFGGVSGAQIKQGREVFLQKVKRIKESREARRKIMAGIAILLVLMAGRWLYHYWANEETDDAFVTARVHAVSSQVSGAVTEVLVQEHQKVKKGDVLARLDPRDYEAQVKSAEAANMRAEKDYARWKGRENQLQPYDRLLSNADAAKALDAEAQLEQAKLRLERTQIVAPEDGTIGVRSVETGEQVQPGQALFSLVENTPWVMANFKEGQVANIHPGQKVSISVDAVPGREFEGVVESLSPGSGATFALLPPDNATGNFTKVVQRIPVKIVFDPDSLHAYNGQLAAGMSTTVTVHVR
jgi:membrane fusion protein (multidrug efflux system)